MKTKITKAILLILILTLPVYNLCGILSNDTFVSASTVDSDFSSLISSLDLQSIEKKIKQLLDERAYEREQKRLAEERRKNYERMAQDIKDGKLSYRKAFSETLVVGDSLMNGLEIYNVLDKSNIISMVSASLYHLEGNYSKIVANNPKKLVLHYGINMYAGSNSQLDFFISMYSRLIRSLKADLPDTEIYVSSIFNVSSSVSGRYTWLGTYNESLKVMCDELEIGFVDNYDCLPGDESYYGKDGIHVSKSFYTDVWLPHLLFAIFG